MNRSDVEALLYRFAVIYPGRGLSDMDAAAQVEEWVEVVAGVDSALIGEAVLVWKCTQDWPPTPRQFLETVESVRRSRPPRNALPAAPEPDPVSGEEGLRQLAHFRELCESATRSVPADERPGSKLVGGALVHRGSVK